MKNSGSDIGERGREHTEMGLCVVFDAGEEFAREQAAVGDVFLGSRTAEDCKVEMLCDIDGAVEMEALAYKDRVLDMVDILKVADTGKSVDAMGIGDDGHGRDTCVKQIVAHG